MYVSQNQRSTTKNFFKIALYNEALFVSHIAQRQHYRFTKSQLFSSQTALVYREMLSKLAYFKTMVVDFRK